MLLNTVIDHIRNRTYMSGVERDSARVAATQEIFTPTVMVRDILDKLDPTVFLNINQDFIDPTCGDGQFLGEVLIRKMENGSTFEQALSTIYGVDLMPDNVKLCQDRLLCDREDLRYIVERTIVNADALRYHYRFDGSHPYDDEVKARQAKQQIEDLFA
jgi:hypothetical protein